MNKDIYKYINEYGDYSFEEEELNIIDYLIFSCLSYMNFESVGNNVKGFKETVKNWLDLKREDRFKGLYMMRRFINLPNSLVEKNRFNVIEVLSYVHDVFKDIDKQFDAVTFKLPNKRIIVSFMGSDNSLYSWKEDLNMSYLDDTPSQILALNYLKEISNKYIDHEINICGYSKGGNLALYSSLKSDIELKKRISDVYVFDGPGFYKNLFNDENLLCLKDKIKLYIPSSSIVGKLLINMSYKNIASRNISIFQHEISSWKIRGKDLVYKNKSSKFSLFIANTINKFVYKHKRDDIRKYINEMFNKFEENNIYVMKDIRKNVFSFIGTIIKVLRKAKGDI